MVLLGDTAITNDGRKTNSQYHFSYPFVNLKGNCRVLRKTEYHVYQIRGKDFEKQVKSDRVVVNPEAYYEKVSLESKE